MGRRSGPLCGPWGALSVLALGLLAPGLVGAGPAPLDLGEILEPLRAEADLPALAALVIADGCVAGQGAVGLRRAGGKDPVTLNDHFHIGSCTKSMSATMIARLVDTGKLKWSQTLAQSLPGQEKSMRAEYREVTLAQVLAHRGGFPKETAPAGRTLVEIHELPGAAPQQRKAYVALALRTPPEVEPGTRYLYSNMGYTVAGHVAEQATGRSWEALIRKWLFEPLGMKSAGFGAPGATGGAGQPWGHHRGADGKLEPVKPGPRADNPPAIGPAGTVHCSIPDLGRFVLAHLKGARGEATRLSPGIFKGLHTPHRGQEYARGWIVVDRSWAGGKALTHAGSNTMWYTLIWIAPGRNAAFVVATNYGGQGAFEACDKTVGQLIGKFLR